MFFGSEPREIGRCLEAYNAPYKRFDRNYYDGSHKFAAFQMDSEVNNGDVVILSLNFKDFYLAIHTFAGYQGTDGLLYCINQYSNATTLTNANDINSVTNYNTDSKHIFRVGYILL